MQSLESDTELLCTDCGEVFGSASTLLKHFAEHAASLKSINNVQPKKTTIPGLFPINLIRKSSEINPSHEKNATGDSDDFAQTNSNSAINVTKPKQGFHEDINGSKSVDSTVKKYRCTYCEKSFKWSTDLKRHTFTHTGERPFKCSLCNSSFIRNQLLQSHILKTHRSTKETIKIPDLKPIGTIIRHKSRKQDKSMIRKKLVNPSKYGSPKKSFHFLSGVLSV